MTESSKRTTPNPTPTPDTRSAGAESMVETILARLAQLYPVENVNSEEQSRPGDLAREVIKQFRTGVAETARKLEAKAKGDSS
jgi:hypothetical protein